MDRIRLCPEPMTKEARERTTARREKARARNFVFPKEKAGIRAGVPDKFPGIGTEKTGAAVDEDAIDKLAAAIALGATLAEDDLLGLRKEALEIAGRLMVKGATAMKVGTETPPPSPGLPQGPMSPPGSVPPTPAPKPPPPPRGSGMTPIASLQPKEAKFASIMENTRQRMLHALLKTGMV